MSGLTFCNGHIHCEYSIHITFIENQTVSISIPKLISIHKCFLLFTLLLLHFLFSFVYSAVVCMENTLSRRSKGCLCMLKLPYKKNPFI